MSGFLRAPSNEDGDKLQFVGHRGGVPVSDKLQFVVALLCRLANFNLSLAYEGDVRFPPGADTFSNGVTRLVGHHSGADSMGDRKIGVQDCEVGVFAHFD